MRTEKSIPSNLVCDICGGANNAQVVSAIKPSWSGPVYIEEVFWCICHECLDKFDLTFHTLNE